MHVVIESDCFCFCVCACLCICVCFYESFFFARVLYVCFCADDSVLLKFVFVFYDKNR